MLNIPYICPLGCGIIEKDKIVTHVIEHINKDTIEYINKLKAFYGAKYFGGGKFMESHSYIKNHELLL